MPHIIDAYLGLNALRQAGYRSTATAVAELVDNSIEANADKIDIIALSEDVFLSNRTSSQVTSIAVLDNGDGMNEETLASCLSMGWGTRLETRDGLGRFGFGLKGSSISQARRVEVYSWTSPGKVMRAHLDLDEIKENGLSTLPEPVTVNLPDWLVSACSEKLEDNGTLVLWSNMDNLDLKRPETLVNRLNGELCRIYRHFLDDDDDYGTKRNITVHSVQKGQKSIAKSSPLLANDPLYLLTPNNLVGYENEATNSPYIEPFSIDVRYSLGGAEMLSKVGFQFTIAQPEIQSLHGSSPQGKHYAKNTGISFVRAGREIDFGNFDFLDRYEPRHRWWGAEVRFEPVLDELFGLTNNKQEVRTIKKVDKDLISDLAQAEQEGDHKTALLLQINKILDENIGQMMKVIKGRKGGAKKVAEKRNIADKVNADVLRDNSITESASRASELSREEKVKERIQLLVDNDSTLSEQEASDIAEATIDYRVDLSTADWPGSLFLDRRPVANASVGIVNRGTKFYDQFWSYLEGQDDQKGFEALEVLMMALVRAEDELVREFDKEVFDRFRERWGHWAERLIKHAAS